MITGYIIVGCWLRLTQATFLTVFITLHYYPTVFSTVIYWPHPIVGPRYQPLPDPCVI